MKHARIYLIPVPIASDSRSSLSQEVIETVPKIRHFIVENAKTARRHLREIFPQCPLPEMEIEEMDKHGSPNWSLFLEWIRQGLDIGIMSESGCPGIADPGGRYVEKAQELQVPIHPLVGPNSMILALMASGLQGQQFAFHGYLPIQNPARMLRIQSLEQRSRMENQTQIFIETPYRNQALWDDLVRGLKPSTKLSVASDIKGKEERIQTRTVHSWRSHPLILPKYPTVFLFLSEEANSKKVP